jgi:hypothetical protein
VRDVHSALSVSFAGVVALPVMLGSVLTLPALLALLGGSTRKLLIAGAALVVVLSAVGVATSGFDREWPRPGALAYVVDAQTSQAYWVSSTRQSLDAWTAGVLGAHKERRPLPSYFGSQRKFWISPAPLRPLAAPGVTVVGERREAGDRWVTLRIAPARPESMLDMVLESSGPITVAAVDGAVASFTRTGEPLRLQHWGAQGSPVEAVVRLPDHASLRVHVGEVTFGLSPEVTALTGARPADTMPMPFGYGLTDSVRVVSSLEL